MNPVCRKVFRKLFKPAATIAFIRKASGSAPGLYSKVPLNMETGAAWQNEDGSVDVYILLRNGTDRIGAEYNYWIRFSIGEEEEVLSCWGYFDADRVTAEAGEVKGYLLHLEADEVRTGKKVWPEEGLWSFISGNNSNYQ